MRSEEHIDHKLEQSHAPAYVEGCDATFTVEHTNSSKESVARLVLLHEGFGHVLWHDD